jgi:hypothetical protein
MSDTVQAAVTKGVPGVQYAYTAARSNLEGAMSVNAQRTGIGSAASSAAKAYEYEMKSKIHRNNMQNAVYDGYYSKNVQFDSTQTQANPSNLSNFGHYDPVREMEQQRRQQEYDARMAHYQNNSYVPDNSSYNNSYDSYNQSYESSVPVPNFMSQNDVFDYLGFDTSSADAMITDIYDAFTNEGNTSYQEAHERLERMQERYLERDDVQQRLSRVSEERRADSAKRMQARVIGDHQATIASQLFMQKYKDRFTNDEKFKDAHNMIYEYINAKYNE